MEEEKTLCLRIIYLHKICDLGKSKPINCLNADSFSAHPFGERWSWFRSPGSVGILLFVLGISLCTDLSFTSSVVLSMWVHRVHVLGGSPDTASRG